MGDVGWYMTFVPCAHKELAMSRDANGKKHLRIAREREDMRANFDFSRVKLQVSSSMDLPLTKAIPEKSGAKGI